MRVPRIVLASMLVMAPALAQEPTDGPKDEKAQKSYKHALEDLHDRRPLIALDDFKKADKQDGGRCLACQKQMVKYGVEYGEWKTAELATEEMIAEAQGERDTALAHYEAAQVFRFQQFVKTRPAEDPERQRALRYIERPELARARMAPPFAVTTVDGQTISMDALQGKVVLLDFWATWCGPCREALPHIQKVAKKFQGEPLVVLSVSLDSDEQKWKDFITKNEMTWPQYRDGGFTGSIAKMFGVAAIPHTFTIDSDGVLQEEHIGDASIEGKLKKLLAQAKTAQPPQPKTN